jgi:hypothetical protein
VNRLTRFGAVLGLAVTACTPGDAGSSTTEVEPTNVLASAPAYRAPDRTALTVEPGWADSITPHPMPGLGLAAVRTDGSIVRVLGGAPADESASTDRLLSLDQATVVEVSSAGAKTRVSWSDTFSGARLGRIDVAGSDLEAAASTEDGSFVALVNRGSVPREGEIAGARSSSTIVLVDANRGERRRFEFRGNYVPEVVGPTEGPRDDPRPPSKIFLLEYTPSEAPTHYRVRVLDTRSGALGLPFSLADRYSQVDARMAGLSRTQAFAGPQQLLFTLYRGVAGEGGRHGYAFVHTLGLIGGVWCLDVAQQMELDAHEGALAVGTGHLVVASANGYVGTFDLDRIVGMGNPLSEPPQMSAVRRFGHSATGEAPAVAALGDRVWVAWGRHVYQLDAATLEPVGAGPYVSERTVSAIAATANGVLLAHPDGTITTSSGAEIRLPDGEREASVEIVRLLVG